MNFKEIIQNKNEIHNIVDKLYRLGRVKPTEIKAFREYKSTLEKNLKSINFILEDYPNSNGTDKYEQYRKELESELEWVNQTTIYTSSFTSLFEMNQITTHLLWTCDNTKGRIWEFKELVELINAYFEIEEPYKAPYKIAYGWQFSLEKGRNGFRPYLYSCIRNYLNKNGVEVTKEQLQKITAMRIVDSTME